MRDVVPGPKAREACKSIGAILTKIAEKGLVDDDTKQVKKQFPCNPRRWDQWWRVLFYVTYFRTGDENFETVHPDALKCLEWMYPTPDERDAEYWRQIVAGVQDPAAAIKSKLVRDVFTEFRITAEMLANNEITKTEASQRMGKSLAIGYDNVRNMNVMDEEIEAKFEELQGQLAKVMRGENPFVKEG